MLTKKELEKRKDRKRTGLALVEGVEAKNAQMEPVAASLLRSSADLLISTHSVVYGAVDSDSVEGCVLVLFFLALQKPKTQE